MEVVSPAANGKLYAKSSKKESQNKIFHQTQFRYHYLHLPNHFQFVRFNFLHSMNEISWTIFVMGLYYSIGTLEWSQLDIF